MSDAPAEPVIETCRSCSGRAELDERSYIIDHDWGLRPTGGYIALPRGSGAYKCAGSGKRSIEWRDRKRAKKLDRHRFVVSAVQQDALVAYDAWVEGRTGFDYDLLLKIALKEHELRFPGAIVVQSNKHSPFMRERCQGGRRDYYHVDVYCTFCRGLLVAKLNASANPKAFHIVKHHPIGCAIQCLAGLREMKPPDHYGLIDEHRALPDEHHP